MEGSHIRYDNDTVRDIDEKKKSDRGPIFLQFFRLSYHWNVYCYLWCRRERLPLVQFSNQKQKLPAPIAQLVECPLRGTGGHGFDPGPRHTKVVKNGTSCSSLGTQTYGV